MRFFACLCLLFAFAAASPTTASARAVFGRYCLEYADGGGGTILDCSYATMAQCWASKTGPADQCYLNPRMLWRRS